mgnify:CR=1 FL=1
MPNARAARTYSKLRARRNSAERMSDWSARSASHRATRIRDPTCVKSASGIACHAGIATRIGSDAGRGTRIATRSAAATKWIQSGQFASDPSPEAGDAILDLVNLVPNSARQRTSARRQTRIAIERWATRITTNDTWRARRRTSSAFNLVGNRSNEIQSSRRYRNFVVSWWNRCRCFESLKPEAAVRGPVPRSGV